MAFWSNLDDNDKAKLATTTGLLVAALAIFTLISTLSFFFTWSADQSLLSDPNMMSASSDVHNWCGKLGYRWSYFLVAKCFGVGSIAFVLILFFISVRLLFKKRLVSLIKSTLVTVTGVIIASFILAFIGHFLGLDSVFGAGLGGEMGSYVVMYCENLFGVIITGIMLVILIAIWLFFISKRFTDWLTGIGESGSEDLSSVDENEVEEKAERKPAKQKKVIPEPAPIDECTHYEPVFPKEAAPAPLREATPPPTPSFGAAKPSVANEPVAPGLQIIKDDSLNAQVKKDLPRINNRDELPDYKFPTLDLLDDYAALKKDVSTQELTSNNNKIRATLHNYKIQVLDVKAVVGPTVTLYKVYPGPGVKISAIKNLQEDIGVSLNAKGVRVVTLSDSVGIEVANNTPSIVPLKSILNDEAFRNNGGELPIALGYTITQKAKVFDLTDSPHLLIAGATKMGKSVGLNVIVASLLYAKHPSELKFVFIDPKMVEFSAYSKLIRHYLAVLPDSVDEQDEMDKAIVKKPKQADLILKSLCTEMDNRYELLSKAGTNNIKLYNEKYKDRFLLPTEGHRFLPYIVTIIDEYADLSMSGGAGPEAKAISRSITNSIIRLAQKGRASGIHVVLATQRPSVDVITGLIKTNFPTRIAFRVVTRVDSATILDSPGAEKLIGKGDMLYYAGVEMERVQCAFIGPKEISSLTSYIEAQRGYKKSYNTPYYLPEPEPEKGEEGGGMIDMKNLDERFEEAARMVVQTQRGSTSDLQRRLGMGYAKAGRVMDQLEAAGIVGPQEGSKPRQVLVPDFATLEGILSAYMGGKSEDEQ
jgi:S-DNA-T family DNA segregation ATPase FtsK/SpoIIIE